jgi:vacuolar-type H+-ATPase subunit I/STV1
MSQSNQTNQMQTYSPNTPIVSNVKLIDRKLALPNYDILMEITRLSDQIKFQKLKIEQKQLLLSKTKNEYRQKLLSEEKGIRSRIVTLKKRQNIGQIVAKIRQSEIELHQRLLDRIDQYEPSRKLLPIQKNSLMTALINKMHDSK